MSFVSYPLTDPRLCTYNTYLRGHGHLQDRPESRDIIVSGCRGWGH